MTIKDLLNLVIPEHFGSDDYSEDTESIEQVYDQLDETVYTEKGATQFVILSDSWDKVAKIPFNGEFYWNDDEDTYYWDPFYHNYVERTNCYFNEAVEEGVDAIFAEVELFGTTKDGTPIYLQDKVTVYNYAEDYDYHSSEDTKKRVLKLRQDIDEGYYWRQFEADWLASAIETYGEEFMKRLFCLFKKNRMLDWHTGNYGWNKYGDPIILDWAGFDN